MTAIWHLRAALLTVFGTVLVHEGRFMFADAEHGHVREAAHGYLAWLTPALAVVLFLAAVQLVAHLRRRTDEDGVPELPRVRSLWLVGSLALLGAFAAQEFVEASLTSGQLPGFVEVFGPGGWVIVPVAVGVAGGIAVLLQGAVAVVAWALARARPRRRRAIALAAPFFSAARVARTSVLARRLAGRAPPALS